MAAQRRTPMTQENGRGNKGATGPAQSQPATGQEGGATSNSETEPGA
jgi:hypothetical protein